MKIYFVKTMSWIFILVLLAACSPKGKLEAPDQSIYEPRQAEFRTQVYNREIEFNKMDKDGDGFLSVDEYFGLEKLIIDMDQDNDGKLSHDESKYMITFAEIPSGTFTMGSAQPLQAFFEPATDCTPQHEVHLDMYQMSATEITNAQYVTYLNSALKEGEIEVRLESVSNNQTRLHYPVPAYAVYGPKGNKYEGKPYVHLSPVAPLSHHKMDNGLLLPEHPLNISWITYMPEMNRFKVEKGFEDWPVCHIKWWGAMAFAEYYGLSLPTEYEWEKAAKGDNDFRYPTHDGKNDGQRANYACYNTLDIPDSKFKGADKPEDYIGFRIKVGSYLPNPFGLYDMAGNVWEWCYDWYDENFYRYCIENNITSNPLNLEGEHPSFISLKDGYKEGLTGGPGQKFSHSAKVCRGGSWNYHEAVTRSEYRFPVYSFVGNDHFGFRVVKRSDDAVFNGTTN